MLRVKFSITIQVLFCFVFFFPFKPIFGLTQRPNILSLRKGGPEYIYNTIHVNPYVLLDYASSALIESPLYTQRILIVENIYSSCYFMGLS